MDGHGLEVLCLAVWQPFYWCACITRVFCYFAWALNLIKYAIKLAHLKPAIHRIFYHPCDCLFLSRAIRCTFYRWTCAEVLMMVMIDELRMRKCRINCTYLWWWCEFEHANPWLYANWDERNPWTETLHSTQRKHIIKINRISSIYVRLQSIHTDFNDCVQFGIFMGKRAL